MYPLANIALPPLPWHLQVYENHHLILYFSKFRLCDICVSVTHFFHLAQCSTDLNSERKFKSINLFLSFSSASPEILISSTVAFSIFCVLSNYYCSDWDLLTQSTQLHQVNFTKLSQINARWNCWAIWILHYKIVDNVNKCMLSTECKFLCNQHEN